jgi:hypothetical protein
MQKADTKEYQEITTPTAISDKKLQDARQLINIFILAWKNYGLYPEDHITTLKSIKNLIGAFDHFFMVHGNLRLNVEKDRLLCGSDLIYELSADSSVEDIITLLYRDGIKWIEFQEGLTLEEIASFFRIAYKYRLFAEETEGDIVTALMDEELEYIDFKAIDIFWQDLLLMDFSKLPPPASQSGEITHQNETDQSQQPTGSSGDEIYTRSIADPSISNTQLELSEADYEIIQQMVREEENWFITEDLFEVLLIILKSQSEQEKFAAVLEYISEEAVEIIEQDKFDLLVKLFQALHNLISSKTSTAEDWKPLHIDQFFQDLSRPEIFQLISEKLLKVKISEIEKLKALGQTLHYFSPEIIPFLVPAFMQRSSPEIQQMISEVIMEKSQHDIGPLETIAKQHGAEIGDKLLSILNRLQGDRVNKILFKMCEHSSDRVRRKAIKELVERDPKYVPRLFSLIDDPSREIRNCIFAAIAKHKSGVLENMLLNYLRENSTQRDAAHILDCYKALGRCGSSTAIPFLRKILLSRGWNSFMGTGKLIFREGAAIALALIDTREANNILKKASKSKFKVVRKAFDRTETIRAVSGENTND